ncbi:hypothetical protein ACTFIZ_008428 [Dictyostelium cf. discoideum]
MNPYYNNALECAEEIFEHISTKHVIDKDNFEAFESFLFYQDIIYQLFNWEENNFNYYSQLNDYQIEDISKDWFLIRFNRIKSLNYILLNILNNENKYINTYATLADKQLIFNNLNLISILIQQLTTQLVTGYYNKILEYKFYKISSKYQLTFNFQIINKIPIHVIEPFTSYTHLIKHWKNQAILNFLRIYNDLNVKTKQKLITQFKIIKRNLLEIHKNYFLNLL